MESWLATEEGQTETPRLTNATRNIMLVLEYDGTSYDGFQIQPGVPTIQGELEAALAKLTGEQIRVNAAGRTDAGVHALGQVVNFTTTCALEPAAIMKALNSLLPADISVRQATAVGPDFHARFSARSREYRYCILNREAKPAIGRQYVYHYRKRLDVEAMREACVALVGTHDYRSFASGVDPTENTVRTVIRAECSRNDDLISIIIEADAFLPKMVRTIVGTLIWVGIHKIDVPRFREIMAARDRSLAGPTAPARGLCLTKVKYQ